MLEMVIDSIRVSLMNYQRVVVLKQRDSERYLPIWIGSPEADAIAVKLQGVTVPRPLTHDLLGSVISTLGASVDHVVITDLSNDTFFAKLVLRLTDGGQTEVDCRPSDAIATAVRGGQTVSGGDGEEHWFASHQEAQKFLEEAGLDPTNERYEVRFKVPIFVEEGVLDKAGIVMDKDGAKQAMETDGRQQGASATPRGVSDEELQRMSAFSEFLTDLPGLEDVGKTPSSES